MLKDKKFGIKDFWIILLLIILIFNYTSFIKIEKELNELQLNLTREFANLDCYERGTVQCYNHTVYCYNEPKIEHTCEEGYFLDCIKN